jgi:hypothetical protein
MARAGLGGWASIKLWPHEVNDHLQGEEKDCEVQLQRHHHLFFHNIF